MKPKVQVFTDADASERTTYGNFISIDHANALLAERATVVYGQESEDTYWQRNHAGAGDTHCALLIGIKPIERDTAESLLRELVGAEGSFRKEAGIKRQLQKARI